MAILDDSCVLRVACACCALRVRVACCVCVLRVLRVACCVCCACCVSFLHFTSAGFFSFVLFNWSFRFFYYIEGVFWPADPFLVDTKKFSEVLRSDEISKFDENFMKTPISWNFEVQKCAWNKILLHMVHALLRDPLRGGRDHFTARKFDQIRSRFDQFCDFLAKIVRFEGFSSFVFHLIFKICWTLQYL